MASETPKKCFIEQKGECIIQDETVIVLGATALMVLIAGPVIVGAIMAMPVLMAPK
jgi:hypothetical protein